MPFTVQRGTNISEWLSQSTRRGAERAAFFNEADMRLIARLGFDHIRLPVDEEQMWDAQGRRDPEAFSLLDAALDWAEQCGLRVIVDLHILRTHDPIDETTPALFTDPAEEAHFAGLWADLSDHLCQRSVNQLAYELLNEAVARDPADWNRVARAAFSTVRQREPERTILLGSNWFNQTQTFDVLEIPDDPRLILTFHYYRPMPITHYTASWWAVGHQYHGPLSYPGPVIAPADMEAQPEALRELLLAEGAADVWGPERIAKDFALPIAVAQRTGHPLYCGEFGAYVATPQPLRLAWYRDMLSVFNQYHISWANWDYKGGFAPVVRDGQPSEIVEVLTQDFD